MSKEMSGTIIAIMAVVSILVSFFLGVDIGKRETKTDQKEHIEQIEIQEEVVEVRTKIFNRAEECFKLAIELWTDVIIMNRIRMTKSKVEDFATVQYYLNLAIYYQNQEIIEMLKIIEVRTYYGKGEFQ